MVLYVSKTLFVLLLGALVAAPVLATPSVLCIGSDGHVAIEQNGSGYLSACVASGRHAHEATTMGGGEGAHRDEHCGACSDYDIANDTGLQAKIDTEMLKRIAMGAMTALPHPPQGLRPSAASVSPTGAKTPPDRYQILSSLRTVVLLS